MATANTPKPAEQPAYKSLAEALIGIQRLIADPAKEHEANIVSKKGGKFKYTYASLETSLPDLRKICADHGVAILQRTMIRDGVVILETRLAHAESKETSEPSEWPVGPLGIEQQELGSGMTYARRYTLFAALNLVPQSDDDANGYDQNHAETGPRNGNGNWNGGQQRQGGGSSRLDNSFAGNQNGSGYGQPGFNGGGQQAGGNQQAPGAGPGPNHTPSPAQQQAAAQQQGGYGQQGFGGGDPLDAPPVKTICGYFQNFDPRGYSGDIDLWTSTIINMFGGAEVGWHIEAASVIVEEAEKAGVPGDIIEPLWRARLAARQRLGIN